MIASSETHIVSKPYGNASKRPNGKWLSGPEFSTIHAKKMPMWMNKNSRLPLNSEIARHTVRMSAPSTSMENVPGPVRSRPTSWPAVGV